MKRDNSTAKAHSLEVSKELGDKAIRLTARLGLLRNDLQVRSSNGFLHIPLKQEPLPSHTEELKKELPQSKVLVEVFSRRAEPSRTAIDLVKDRLPPHLLASFPRAIDFVGDIAITEIPPELQEQKRLIGEMILEAHKHVRTVLAKSGAVSGVYRVREYEVIAGSRNTETVHKEHGCKYHLDLRKVYFSPRLSYEHMRVASQVKENETVVDMFAGVGPFSILIAKTHLNVKVYAVDANPDAVRYLQRNTTVNRVVGKVVPVLGDAGEVIRERLLGTADRVIMNLPERAVDYLGMACEALNPGGGVMHYYDFACGSDALETVKSRLAETLGREGRNVEESLSERLVREVAPFKWQVAVDVRVR